MDCAIVSVDCLNTSKTAKLLLQCLDGRCDPVSAHIAVLYLHFTPYKCGVIPNNERAKKRFKKYLDDYIC